MPIYIEMPKLADTMTDGILVRWLKKEGDTIKMGDVFAEVETDKATMEIPSYEEGILHKLIVPAGTKVEVGGQLAMLLAKGEKPPAEGAATPEPKAKSEPAPAEASNGQEAHAVEKASGAGDGYGKTAATAVMPATGGRTRISPLARKIAAEKGLEISALKGTGPGGRIIARDVESGATITASAAGPGYGAPGEAGKTLIGTGSAQSAPVASMPAGEGDQRIALSGMRRVIAERLLASKTQLPHFYLHIEVDAGPLMTMRAQLNAASEAAGGPKLTVNDFILKAVIAAAVKVPAVNASFAGDSIIQYAAVNLAVAVAVDDGLVTPVIRDAQRKGLREISEAVKDLAGRARSKKLKPDEYQGGTITVSNLGAYGIEFFDAIINPPQAMIVAIGAILKKPVVGANDQIVVGQRMAVGLSADHRVVDGAVGAQYLAELRRLLEQPALMLM